MTTLMDALIRYFVYCCACRKTVALEKATKIADGSYQCKKCEAELVEK